MQTSDYNPILRLLFRVLYNSPCLAMANPQDNIIDGYMLHFNDTTFLRLSLNLWFQSLTVLIAYTTRFLKSLTNGYLRLKNTIGIEKVS